MTLFLTLLAMALVLSVLTLLPLWRHEAWWVRALDFPRIQLFLFASLLFLLGLAMLDLSHPATWGLLAVVLLCLAFQIWWIIPYTRFFPVEVQPARQPDPLNSIRILTANVLTPNRNADSLIELVQENTPDVIVTLESDLWWQSKLDVLENEYCYTLKCPLDNLYGMHVYSKLPLSDSHIEFLVEKDIPSMHTLMRLPSGQQVRAHFLHPAPPSPTENEESIERDVELILVAKSLAESNLPVIVTGDLNDVAWSETTRLFRKISGLLDPRVGRGMYNTFHADYWFMRWPLDHLFHSDHFSLSRIQRLRSFGSDHFALFTELVFETSRALSQEGLDNDASDHAIAEDKLEKLSANIGGVPTLGGH